MTEDDEQGPTSAPGFRAGDAAQTQAIPRVPKPVKKAPGKSGAGAAATQAKKKPAATAATKDAMSTSTHTDKGRPRETQPTDPIEPDPAGPQESSAATSENGTQGTRRPGADRPLTAADYAHTTKPSAATTAVIPAVKEAIDKGGPSSQKSDANTFEPGPDAGVNRRASLRLTHIDPWSVTRLAFAISVAMMIVGVVAVTIFWVVLDMTGVWDQINGSVTTVLSDDSSSFNITDYLGFGRMVGLSLVLSAINVILMTALATIGAHLYNLAAQLLGGVELTFSEEK